MKKLLALVVSFCFVALAHAAADPERYLLTAAILQKVQAVNKELAKANIKDNDRDDDKKELSVEEFVRVLESEPKAKAALAKHGISTMDFALATYASLAAGIHLMFEPSMDKKKAASLIASYSKERQANIELLRKNPQYMSK